MKEKKCVYITNITFNLIFTHVIFTQTDKLNLVSAKEREMKQVILEKELQIAAKDHQLKEMFLARSKERIEHELQLSKRDTQLSAKESRLSEEHSRLFLLQQRCDLSETQLDTAQGKIQSLQVCPCIYSKLIYVIT